MIKEGEEGRMEGGRGRGGGRREGGNERERGREREERRERGREGGWNGRRAKSVRW